MSIALLKNTSPFSRSLLLKSCCPVLVIFRNVYLKRSVLAKVITWLSKQSNGVNLFDLVVGLSWLWRALYLRGRFYMNFWMNNTHCVLLIQLVFINLYWLLYTIMLFCFLIRIKRAIKHLNPYSFKIWIKKM